MQHQPTPVSADKARQALAELVPGGVVVLDDQGAVELANRRALELLGAGDLEDLRRRWAALAHGPGLTSGGAGEEVVLEAPETGTRLRLRSLQEAGSAGIFLLEAVDREEALAEDLEDLSRIRASTYLHRSLAHDLKSPLNSLVLNLDLARELAGSREGGEVNQVREQLDVLSRELARLGRSLGAVLEQIAPDDDEPLVFDLRRLVRELSALARVEAKVRRLRVELQTPEEQVPVYGRRWRLKQAMVGLLVNALEAVDEGGSIGLGVGVEGDWAVLTIRDDGCGLPRVPVERLFDPDVSTKGRNRGTGLPVARRVVESLGGSVRVESCRDTGALVKVKLPGSREKEAEDHGHGPAA